MLIEYFYNKNKIEINLIKIYTQNFLFNNIIHKHVLDELLFHHYLFYLIVNNSNLIFTKNENLNVDLLCIKCILSKIAG